MVCMQERRVLYRVLVWKPEAKRLLGRPGHKWVDNIKIGGSEWPRGLRRGSEAARLLGLWVLIPPRAWMFNTCECCVVKYGSLRRADHSSRGVLPTVVCLSVIVNPR